MPVVSFDYIEQREKMAEEITRLRAEVKTRTLDYLGQVGQLSEEIERLRAALRDIHASAKDNHLIANIARAALAPPAGETNE